MVWSDLDEDLESLKPKAKSLLEHKKEALLVQ